MTLLKDEWQPPRRLRVFAFDPSTARAYANRETRHVTISVTSEMEPELKPGPCGEYLEVIDHDPASKVFYKPVKLDDANILSGQGLDPAADDPRFHQQMVYAVAMNTIASFEEALGRPILWAPFEQQKSDDIWETTYIARLRIYPHALREANAYYSPTRHALLFGYFEAGPNSKGAIPGTAVFTCLSHDIIVHETVHAILDGLHPHFAENSHPDMLALHEAFADIVAIFQLFSFPEVLEAQIARTRGNLESQSMLGKLAQEFGKTLGRSGALRDALGKINEDGDWEAKPANPVALAKARGPHDRGSILVAALFRAFLNIYRAETEDLFRMASGGSGILREGALDPDLARRLSVEAAKIARRMLRIAIRAMDYLPPVAVSFGDYLRGIITADHDLYPEDEAGYRIAIIEAFSAWGIVPEGMPVITETTLLWPSLSQKVEDRAARLRDGDQKISIQRVRGALGAIINTPQDVIKGLEEKSQDIRKNQNVDVDDLTPLADESRDGIAERVNSRVEKIEDLRQPDSAPVKQAKPRRAKADAAGKVASKEYAPEPVQLRMSEWADRELEFHSRIYLSKLVWMMANAEMTPALAEVLGLTLSPNAPQSIRRSKRTKLPSLHVLPVRRARRIGGRGKFEDEYVIELIQTRYGFLSEADQNRAEADVRFAEEKVDFKYRAGCTLLVSAQDFNVRRLIRTPYPVHSEVGLARARDHYAGTTAPRNAFDGGSIDKSTTFAVLHRHYGQEPEGW